MISGIDEKTGQPADLKRIPKKVLDKEDFMKLFITQLQYQDPMKPIDNNEMAMQLALFNQVDQLFNINDTLKHFMDYVKKSDLGVATSLIGKVVKVQDNMGRVEDGKFLGGEFILDEPENLVEVTIRDSKGKLIKKLDLTSLSKGTHKIEWDGTDEAGKPVPDGNYTISVVIPGGENTKTITPIMHARVTGAVLDDSGVKVKIDEAKDITLDQIKEILGG